MKTLNIAGICILVFLAVSSGVAKILTMPQDVALFDGYGFTTPLLIAFGAVQLVGGVMIIFRKTRLVGAATVAATFAISAVVLIMEGNIPIAAATLVALVLLGSTIQQTLGGGRVGLATENDGD